jgi:hypothetical protein
VVGVDVQAGAWVAGLTDARLEFRRDYGMLLGEDLADARLSAFYVLALVHRGSIDDRCRRKFSFTASEPPYIGVIEGRSAASWSSACSVGGAVYGDHDGPTAGEPSSRVE